MKKSSTLKFMMNISFEPSVCIHRSIILIFIEKSMLVNFFFFSRKIFFPRFSIFISARIIFLMNSRLCTLLEAVTKVSEFVCLFVGCLTSQQHASVSQGRICSDNFTCCHTEIEAADQTFHLTQSQYTDTGPTSPSADPITPGAWQGSHWSANF